MKTGFKEMLRDRVPPVVNYALKWQKAKELWLNHVYEHFIDVYSEKEDRYNATRIVLGLSKSYRNFDFDKTIDWDNCTPEEEKYWKRVSSWVSWFRKTYQFIENGYRVSKQTGKDETARKVEIINTYLSTLMPDADDNEETKTAKYKYVDSLVDFLIKCIEK